MAEPHCNREQQGAVLISGLGLLLVISLLGMTAMSTATMEEYMARNLRDHNLAFEAAEAALRAGERDVRNALVAGPGSLPLGEPGFHEAAEDVWLYVRGVENARTLPVDHVSSDARYVVEELIVPTPPGESLTRGPHFLYRITGAGFGAGTNDLGEPQSRVTLQSIYAH